MIEKDVVIRFLNQCNSYAQNSIQRKKERGEENEIRAWESYIKFNQHAIDEITDGTLDDWFHYPIQHDELSAVDFDGMEHQEKSKWLTALLSPRPISIIATKQADEKFNLSTISSCMHVSTSPPYILASFSKHRDGEMRDTLLHLRQHGKATLNFFQGHPDVLNMIETAARPLNFGHAEAEQLHPQSIPNQNGVLPGAIGAIEVEFVQEYDMPDAVAKLALLKVVRVWYNRTSAPDHIEHLLCQHGMDRIGRLLLSEETVISSHYEPIRHQDSDD
jgi:flavin reductase (DIM6/NTAB) family NADH-FMN oxidoreductase RutF